MSLIPLDEQIQAVLYGDSYALAVRYGMIEQGSPLPWAKVFTVTQRDLLDYLGSHSVPGLDVDLARFQPPHEGPQWRREGAGFVIGWTERGKFRADHHIEAEPEFRAAWVKYLVRSHGLPE